MTPSRRRHPPGLPGVLLGLLVGLAMLVAATAEPLYPVVVEQGTRFLPTGDRVAYALYLPQPAAGLPPPPWPALVLTHGFARSLSFHAANARYLAERGIVVLTPNLAGLIGGDPAQLRNIANTTDHVRWLAERSMTSGDALAGLLDPARIALAGHSAGAAISFEAAIVLAFGATPAAAVALLDGVPWPRTIANGGRLPAIPFASLRSEPGGCNANGNITLLLDVLRFPNEDVRIVGGTHCDPENPTEALCTSLCGGTSSEGRGLYRRLTYLFLRDALGAPALTAEDYDKVLDELVASAQVVVERRGLPLPLTSRELPHPGWVPVALGGMLALIGLRRTARALTRPD